tara:strand:- start:2177 stop:2767 length:591 start_codon:yes stop_codon:yes gene_type:complete
MSRKLLKNYDLFDFDRTLIDNDTLYGFYLACNNKNIPLFKRLSYLVIRILNYFNIISNTQFKKLGVKLFLAGQSKSKINFISSKYAKSLKLNKLYYKKFKKSKNKVVITASFENYVKKVFEKDKVIVFGSSLLYDETNVVIGLKANLYGSVKKEYLLNKGFDYFVNFYTDSLSDSPLFSLCKNIYLVKNGNYNSKK